MFRLEPKHNSTAILLFIREEHQEAVVKPLVNQRGVDSKVYGALNQHIKKEIKRTGYPVFIVQGDNQSGTSFAERFANAFESVYQLGYENVLALGNDSPRLNAPLIASAAKALCTSDMVLGPSRDGGVYLIGLNKRAYQRENFIQFQWQTAWLYRSIVAHRQPNIQLHVLSEVAIDIDNGADLKRFLNSGVFNLKLRSRLRKLISTCKTPYPFISAPPAFWPGSSASLRAPPILG